MNNSYTGAPEAGDIPAIVNNGFFPDLTVLELTQLYRIPNEYEMPEVKDRLMTAMIDVNEQLAPLRTALSAYATLAAYTAAHSEQIGGVEVLLTKYKEAVFSYAKSGLLQKNNRPNAPKEVYSVEAEDHENEVYWRTKSTDAVSFLFNRAGVLYTPRTRTSALAILI